MTCWFITGTDTEVGKTVASCALLQAANTLGMTTAGYKPVASGSKLTASGVFNEDALALQRNSSIRLSYGQVNPIAFVEPTSPHIVSIAEGRAIEFSHLSAGLHTLKKKAQYVIVEGAGGWYTPLSQEQTYADWVVSEKLPVILVIGIKLGCINHAILTIEAIKNHGLSLAGWIANDITPPGKRHSEYMDYLKNNINARFLGEIPYLSNVSKEYDYGQYLNIESM